MMARKAVWLMGAWAAAHLAVPAWAADVVVKSKPKEVTVFPQGARVLRSGEVPLKKGPVTVVFPDIPAGALDSSIRLSAEGPAGTRLFGVELRSAFTTEEVETRVKELKRKLAALEDEKGVLQDQISARSTETDILGTLAKESAARAGAQAGQKPEKLSALAAGVKDVGKRIDELLAESRSLAHRQRDLDREITVLKRELGQVGQGSRKRKVARAEMELGRDGKVSFEIAYMVRSARWNPLYDLRLDGSGQEPTAGLTFAAQVIQNSGEDWNGVKLTLSTARPAEGTTIPDPTNWWLDFYRPRTVKKSGRYSKGAVPAAAPSMAAADEEAPEPVKMAQAVTERAEYATDFIVKRAAAIPSDGSAHRVGIAESAHPVKILLVCVPRLVQAAFIEAQVKYEGEQSLIPGTANLFRGAQFVGTTNLKSIAPGESFTIGLGKDQNTKVERKLIADKSGREGLIFKKGSRRYEWVTTLQSFHTGARTVEVREQLPRSRQKDIVVTEDKMSPRPLAESSLKPGLKRFRIKLEPKVKARVTFAYSVKYPKDKRVSGLE